MGYSKADIKPEKRKYVERFGKTARRGDESDFILEEQPKWLDASLVQSFEIAAVGEGDVSIEQKLKGLGQLVVKDVEDYLAVGPLAPFVNAVGGDAVKLLQNLYHGRRKKSSGTILGATAMGAGIGGFIGFWVIPGVGHVAGIPVGAMIGVFGGMVAVTLSTVVFKRKGENLAKKWFPGDYRYDLDRETTKGFKKKYGIPNHVLQLMNGYLHNRMLNIKNPNLKNVLANFSKIGIEGQDKETFCAILLYLGEELEAVKQIYTEKHKAYYIAKLKGDSDEVNKLGDELKKYREDFHLLQYMLQQVAIAKVNDEVTIKFPESLEDKLTLQIPKIASEPGTEMMPETNWKLSDTRRRLEKEAEATRKAHPLRDLAEVGARALLSNVPATANVISTGFKLLTPEGREDFSNKMIQKVKQDAELAVRNVIVNTISDGATEFKFEVEAGKLPIPPIVFEQISNATKIATRLSMKIESTTVEDQIQRAAKIMIQEVEQLLKEVSSDDIAGYQLDIDADNSLTEIQRIASAVHLSLGAKRLGVEPYLVGFTSDQKQKIQEKVEQLAPANRTGAGITLKRRTE
ncbi:MAG: hypothetical protein U1E78_05520 [Gammaproteobacteria bacterium]